MRDQTMAAARDNLSRRLPADWCAELFQSCDGEWSIIAMAAEGDASYLITASATGFELAALIDDALSPMSRHNDLDAVITLAAATIARKHNRPSRAA